MINILFLFIGIIIGWFLDKSRIVERTKKTQKKINNNLKYLQSTKIHKVTFQDGKAKESYKVK